MTGQGVIRVVAGLVVDPEGRLLLVRKRGTDRFMQAGGKPEAGETSRAALVRELQEEVGAAVDESALVPIGGFTTAAANEPGHRLEADVFLLEMPVESAAALRPKAEIVELRWLRPCEAALLGDRLAPLAHLLLDLAPDTRRSPAG